MRDRVHARFQQPPSHSGRRRTQLAERVVYFFNADRAARAQGKLAGKRRQYGDAGTKRRRRLLLVMGARPG